MLNRKSISFHCPVFFIVPLSVLLFLASCSGGQLLTEANQALERGEFYAATEKYKQFNEKEKDAKKKFAAAKSIGDAYFGQGLYPQAASWYKNAIRRGDNDLATQFRYIDVLRAAEKYDEMENLLKQMENNAGDNRFLNNQQSLRMIRQWQKLPPVYLIESLKAPNSFADETSVAAWPRKADRLLFASASEEATGKQINPVTGQKFADIFVAEYDSARHKWSFAKTLGDSLKINTEANESAISVSADGQLIVFQRAEYVVGQKMNSRLFFCRKENSVWSKPEPISFCNDGASYAYPAISVDGKWLFFSSDRAGGQGQTDIWKSGIANYEFGEPLNMGEQINTPGRETSPFMRKNGHFYFSSDYHPGVGGFDIFHATADLNGKWTVENMSTPVNSPNDDFGLIFAGRGERGYFASTRKGSRGADLYSFFLPPRLFQCFGKVCSLETDSVIDNVNVRIVGTDGTSMLMKTEKGTFRAELKPEADYAVMVFKKGFLNAQAKISTRGLREAFDFNLELKQTPTDQPIRIDDINYESGKWELQPASRASLDKVVEILSINPDISIEIMSHTDDVGDAAFNMDLSQKRADEVVRYLIQKGVSANRLKAKGYGESLPFRVRVKTARKYSFLKEGEVLNTKFIEQIGNEQEAEVARSLNRRTEFQVLQ